jgi:hypothetical protein
MKIYNPEIEEGEVTLQPSHFAIIAEAINRSATDLQVEELILNCNNKKKLIVNFNNASQITIAILEDGIISRTEIEKFTKTIAEIVEKFLK